MTAEFTVFCPTDAGGPLEQGDIEVQFYTLGVSYPYQWPGNEAIIHFIEQ